jgi:phosphohistidine phosphatase
MRMKLLYLMRHAKSSWDEPGLSDHDRPLDARGERAAALMGTHLAQRGLRPTLVLCSSARRTRQTLERIQGRLLAKADALREAAEPTTGGHAGELAVRIERDLYGATAGQLLARLRRVNDEESAVLVVGHNPGIADLAQALAGGGDRASVRRLEGKFPTATLVAFRVDLEHWSELSPGCGQLTEFTTPKDLV